MTIFWDAEMLQVHNGMDATTHNPKHLDIHIQEALDGHKFIHSALNNAKEKENLQPSKTNNTSNPSFSKDRKKISLQPLQKNYFCIKTP